MQKSERSRRTGPGRLLLAAVVTMSVALPLHPRGATAEPLPAADGASTTGSTVTNYPADIAIPYGITTGPDVFLGVAPSEDEF